MLEKVYVLPMERYDEALVWIETHTDAMEAVAPVPLSWVLAADFDTLSEAVLFRLGVSDEHCWRVIDHQSLLAVGARSGTDMCDAERDARAVIDDMDEERSRIWKFWIVNCAFTREDDAERFAIAMGAVEIEQN